MLEEHSNRIINKWQDTQKKLREVSRQKDSEKIAKEQLAQENERLLKRWRNLQLQMLI
jgi:hypothetical protein